uniref:Ppx/GppA phosphatase N-terminal domain-containing protein n=1 Tax=Kalanchoe fedtschenkoi TaxID=63787 RepID=A0A7N0UGU2_KALFE
MSAASVPLTPQLLSNPNNLHAAIDMGTNSFKLHIIQADPSTGKFLSLDRFKEPVLLGQSTTGSSSLLISSHAQARAIAALRNFSRLLKSSSIADCRVVATSAVREAVNRKEFLDRVEEEVGMTVEVLSGEDEGKYVYMGVLQFVPHCQKLVLCIDIGGGSTEFVVGCGGKVLYAASLRLGHVVLTQEFLRNGELLKMREHVRKVIQESGLVEKVRGIGFEVVVGSSGTIRAIEKAVLRGYGSGSHQVDEDVLLGDSRTDWSFSREELSNVVQRLGGDESKTWRGKLFKRRSEFIFAGAVLLEEIVDMLGIAGIDVSGYALGEGIIAEKLARVCEHYDQELNARWRSVIRLTSKFNNKKGMKSAAQCAAVSKVPLI